MLEFGRRTPATIDDFQLWLVSKEDLILSKLLWARESHSEIQFADVRNLLDPSVDAVCEVVRAPGDFRALGRGVAVKDTPPLVEAQYRALLMARSPVERFRMAVDMFDTARAIVMASLPHGLPIEEIRRRLAQRFYGDLPDHQLPAELRRH